MELQLNNYHIKMLAAIWMVVDHVGAIFFPKIVLFRIIGRLSFPLFGWLLVQGERHTRNFNQYLIRLVVLGAISQPVYYLALAGRQLNILFTLALGLILLRLSRRFANLQYLIWAGGMVAAQLVQVEYGAYGIALIGLFAKFRPHPVWWLAWIGLHLLILLKPGLGLLQLPAVAAPLVIHFANYHKGASARWFYSFYPLHLLVLFLLSQLRTSGL